MMTNTANTNAAQLMRQLQEIDFSIIETALYLDAYPDHPQALEYYHQLVAEREKLLAQYETHHGPLTLNGNRSRNSWDWVKTPWPWEPEAN